MTRHRRSFDPGFRLEVVKMIKEHGLSVQHVSESMSTGTSAIRRRVAQSAAEQSGQPGIGKPLTAEQNRIRQLEQKSRQLRANVDILIKASAFFARELKAELNPPGLPLGLGAGANPPLQLTQAYAAFANGGLLVHPRLILDVSERGGHMLYPAGTLALPSTRIVSKQNAYVMDSMLRDVVQKGTARSASRLGRSDLAGKTGTSNNARDVWFAGYSSEIASVVWIGYDQPRRLGAFTGGNLALPVWTQYMKTALVGR